MGIFEAVVIGIVGLLTVGTLGLRYSVHNKQDTVVDLVRIQEKQAKSLVDGKQSVYFIKSKPKMSVDGVTFQPVAGNGGASGWQNLISEQFFRLAGGYVANFSSSVSRISQEI